jgi:hypothetical protein
MENSKELIMNRKLRVFITVCSFLIITNQLYAEEMKKLAQTSMKWLAIPVGARPMAMGNAYYSMGGSAGDIFWNPGGVGFVESPQLFISHMPWIADVSQIAGAAAYPVGKIGIFSASVRAIDFGSQQGTIRASNDQGWIYTGEFTPSSYQIGIGFAQRVTHLFSYGIHISYAQENLGTVYYAPVSDGDFENPQKKRKSMSLYNIDFGVLYYTGFHDLRLGMTLRNFAEERGYGNVGNPIPMDWRFGMAMNVLLLFLEETGEHKLTVTWDLSHPRDYGERLHFGLEYTFVELLSLRLGYKTNYDEEGLSFGAGILPKIGVGSMKVGLDYAYLPFGVFGSVQSFSFLLSF